MDFKIKGGIYLKSYKGIIYSILASVAFGLMPIFAKFAYINGSNPTTVLIFRFGISSIILLVYSLFKGLTVKIPVKKFTILFITGLIGYTLTTQTLFVSYNYLGVGLSTTLHFIYPAFVCILEYLFFKNKMSRSKLFSLVFAGLGVYSLVAFENHTMSTIGLFLAIFSGLSYGTNVIMLAMESIKDLPNEIITMYLSFGATVGMIIYGLFTKEIIYKVNFEMGISYILISVVSTILSIIFLLKGIALIGASSASILGTFEPIISIIMGVILFKEPLSFSLVLGTILIIISTVILATDKSSSETIDEIIEEKATT